MDVNIKSEMSLNVHVHETIPDYGCDTQPRPDIGFNLCGPAFVPDLDDRCGHCKGRFNHRHHRYTIRLAMSGGPIWLHAPCAAKIGMGLVSASVKAADLTYRFNGKAIASFEESVWPEWTEDNDEDEES